MLAAKAAYTGLDPSEIDRLDRAGRALRVTVKRSYIRRASNENDENVLHQLEVARPAGRFDDPRVEFSDRVARLHRFAWQLAGRERADPPARALVLAG